MAQVEIKQAPSLFGWVFAAAAALVAAAVAFLLVGVGLVGSAFIGILVLLVVGLILGLPGKALPGPVTSGIPAPTPVKAPVAPAPVMAAPVAPPAPAMAAPVAPPAPVAAPVMAPAPLMAEVPSAGTRPAALDGPRGGKADDLKLIEGIGPKMESLCHSLGFYHFDQIASWTPAEVAWVDANLAGFKGRVTRDKWVAQARLIGEIGIDAFLIRAKTNDY